MIQTFGMEASLLGHVISLDQMVPKIGVADRHASRYMDEFLLQGVFRILLIYITLRPFLAKL